jgi:hypothetical protein
VSSHHIDLREELRRGLSAERARELRLVATVALSECCEECRKLLRAQLEAEEFARPPATRDDGWHEPAG